MALVAILGDVHLGASRSSDIIHNYFSKFYGFFFDLLEKKKIDVIIQEGDLFDYRKEIHFNTMYRAKEYFFDKLTSLNIQMITLAGNHDVLYKNTNRINSVRLMATKQMRVVDMLPETILIGSKTFDLYPWINPENLDASLKFAKESKSDYAVGHFEFVDFPMHPGTVATSGMKHSLFSNYEHVYSGHYHTVSQKDNILYTGTPCELNWSDCGDPKGFWILDTETGLREFIRNPYNLFEKISYIEGMPYDFTQVTEKYVKIVVADKTDQKKFDAFVDKVNKNSPHDVKIIESSVLQTVSEAVTVTDLVTTHQMISNVIDNMDTQLDKVKLKQAVLELYAEAMAINNEL